MHHEFEVMNMRTATRLSDSILDLSDEAVPDRGESQGSSDRCYARDLRVIGQLLESHGVVSVDLVQVGGTYIIRGKVGSRWHGSSADHSRSGWIARFGLLVSGQSKPRDALGETVELRYNSGDIRAFESQVLPRRDDSNGMPDPYALSQVLRSAGAYLDTRQKSSLIGISLRERWMKIRFESGDGCLEEAQQDIEYFYDYWVKMYLRRNTRAQVNFFAA